MPKVCVGRDTGRRVIVRNPVKLADTVIHRLGIARVGDPLAQLGRGQLMTCCYANRMDHWFRQPVGWRVRRSVVLLAFLGVCVTPAAASAETLKLTWNASASPEVTSYIVAYGTSSGSYTTTINVGNQTSYTVTGLTAGARYYFAVQAVSPGGTSSFSNQVSSIPFTDSALASGLTTIRAAHINDLRSRINTLRTANGLAAQSWTDPTLSTAIPVRAQHITELRAALNDVYLKLNMALPTYTDPVMVAHVTPAKAAHIIDLRKAVVAIE